MKNLKIEVKFKKINRNCFYIMRQQVRSQGGYEKEYTKNSISKKIEIFPLKATMIQNLKIRDNPRKSIQMAILPEHQQVYNFQKIKKFNTTLSQNNKLLNDVINPRPTLIEIQNNIKNMNSVNKIFSCRI